MVKDRLRVKVSLRPVVLAVALSTAVVSYATSSIDATANPANLGEWSEPFDMGGIAIHATLTHTGDVLFFQYVEGKAVVDHTSYVGRWNYRTGVTAEAPLPYDRDVFCAANNVLPDGKVFISGGHDHTTGKKQDGVGVAETDTYDPATRTWKPGPLLGEKRWYPTSIGLSSGKTLIFGGQARAGAPSHTVDEYDPVTGTMRRLPATATKAVGVYPRMHTMPSGKVLKTGPSRQSAFFDPSTNSWANVAPMMFGPRTRGNSILLPGATQVLAVGGQASSSSPPTGTAEILDTAVASPRWRYTRSLNYPRLHANTVNLPDGQVLIVGGGAQHKYAGPVKTPEMYDPATETWQALAPQQGSRMYHSTALLLPDGRVLSAGQDDGPLATFGEVFSPPYLFRGARPGITSAPSSTGYGGQLSIASPEAGDIESVTLIKAGSVTHSVDTDQRSVPLRFTAVGGTISAEAPANPKLAPPGYYMLFIVNSDGVPSIAPWVHLG